MNALSDGFIIFSPINYYYDDYDRSLNRITDLFGTF